MNNFSKSSKHPKKSLDRGQSISNNKLTPDSLGGKYILQFLYTKRYLEVRIDSYKRKVPGLCQSLYNIP